MKKHLILLFVVAVIAVMLFGGISCKSTTSEVTAAETTASEAEPAKAWTIGFNNFQNSHEFCAKVSKSI